MESYLDKIVAVTRETVRRRRSETDPRWLYLAAEAHVPRGFARALRARSVGGAAIIAELKKASPSRGLIREHFDVASLAQGMERGGAAALSVLTEERFFQGSLDNLQVASGSVQIPCLRKDFIVDEFQLLEARAHGADAVLFIAAALSDGELARLRKAAADLQLDVLCEVHDGTELARINGLSCEAVGVNSRNLKTLDVDLNTAFELAGMLPRGCLAVAESGIRDAGDVQRLRDAGYAAFLIGESLMKHDDPGKGLSELFAGVTRLSSREVTA